MTPSQKQRIETALCLKDDYETVKQRAEVLRERLLQHADRFAGLTEQIRSEMNTQVWSRELLAESVNDLCDDSELYRSLLPVVANRRERLQPYQDLFKPI